MENNQILGSNSRKSSWQKLKSYFAWTKSSYYLMSAFLAILSLIIAVWWPLVIDYATYFDPEYPIWRQLDFLLIGIFLVMSILIMAGADLTRDFWIIVVGLIGGLVIEGWGTQSQIWTYYTYERPPLWIIPAWPIASLSIDRLVKVFTVISQNISIRFYRVAYWVIFIGFIFLMTNFVSPTVNHSLTVMALITSLLIILSPYNHRLALNTFICGSGLGYFLELWGTTRGCWFYYTLETPPIFAIFAHGLAAVAFWRAGILIRRYMPAQFKKFLPLVQ